MRGTTIALGAALLLGVGACQDSDNRDARLGETNAHELKTPQGRTPAGSLKGLRRGGATTKDAPDARTGTPGQGARIGSGTAADSASGGSASGTATGIDLNPSSTPQATGAAPASPTDGSATSPNGSPAGTATTTPDHDGSKNTEPGGPSSGSKKE